MLYEVITVDEGMMQSAVDAYNELVYQPYQPYKTMRDMYDIGVTPRAMWVGKGWVSSFSKSFFMGPAAFFSWIWTKVWIMA